MLSSSPFDTVYKELINSDKLKIVNEKGKKVLIGTTDYEDANYPLFVNTDHFNVERPLSVLKESEQPDGPFAGGF